jgi:YVTN family beta-propeller protein
MGSNPTRVVVGDRDVWVADAGDRTLARISSDANALIATVKWSASSGGLVELAVGEGAIWTLQWGTSPFEEPWAIWTYDPRTTIWRRAVTGRAGESFHTLDARGGYLWTDSMNDDEGGTARILKIHPVTREVLWRTRLPIQGSSLAPSVLLAVRRDDVCFASDNPHQTPPVSDVWHLDARNGRVLATIKLGFAPGDIAVDEAGVWLTDPFRDSVLRIDPATDHAAETIRVGRSPERVAVGAGSVWTANTRDGTVSPIDPKTFDVKTVDVGGTPEDLAVGLDGAWVVVQPR